MWINLLCIHLHILSLTTGSFLIVRIATPEKRITKTSAIFERDNKTAMLWLIEDGGFTKFGTDAENVLIPPVYLKNY